MSVSVKICGITRLVDAMAAVQAGADAIGFVFADSPRRIDPVAVLEIISKLPDNILKAGVFVDEDPDVVAEIAEQCSLGLLQFHGNETPEYCARFGEKAVKAFRVTVDFDLTELDKYHVRAFLLDTYAPGRPGGTGKTFDWTIAAEAAADKVIILSGGLNPDNIAEAIRVVQPAAVDVSSGVESEPGLKDHDRLRSFILNAKREQI